MTMVKTECQNILDLIPNGDCVMTEKLFRGISTDGACSFTFNIDEKPILCYESKIVSSLVVLEAMSDILLRLEFQGISLNAESQFESKYINELLCNLRTVNDDLLAWMSQCVVAAVTTAIHSITFMRDISSLVPLKKPTIESTPETNPETSQFAQFSRTQARKVLSLLATKTQKVICPIEDELVLHITSVVMNALVEKIEEPFHEKLKPGQKLHRELCALYGSVKSQSTSNVKHSVDCIQDLAFSSQLRDTDFEIVYLTNIAADLVSKSLNGSITSADVSSIITEITATAAENAITTAISKISDLLAGYINTFIQNVPEVGYINDDDQILEAMNKVLTSVCSDIIRSSIESRIIKALMLDLQENTLRSYSLIYEKLSNYYEIPMKNTPAFKYSNIISGYSSRVLEGTDCLRTQSMTESEARLASRYFNRNIIILDVDREVIVTYSSPENR